MEISQINKGLYSYIEVRRFDDDASDFEIEMLKNNELDTISPLSSFEYDDETILRYKVDGLCSVSKLFRHKKPDGNDVKKLFLSISDAICELREYMLNPRNIVFEEESVLYDEKRERSRFIYVPGNDIQFQKGVKNLCEEIMKHFDHSDKDGTVFFYDIYSEFLKENFTPDMFLELMKTRAGWKDKSNPNPIKQRKKRVLMQEDKYPEERASNRLSYGRENAQLPGGISEAVNKQNDEELKKQKNGLAKKIIIAGVIVTILSALIIAFTGGRGLKAVIVLGLAFSAYSIYKIVNKPDGMDEADRAMNEMNTSLPTYIREGIGQNINQQENRYDKNNEDGFSRQSGFQKPNQEDDLSEKTITKLMPEIHTGILPIMIGDGDITVGRSARFADYMLSEPGISRRHATISKKGGKIVISDNDSTNGTYINNRRIEKGHEEKLSYGDVVSFAGTEFYCL